MGQKFSEISKTDRKDLFYGGSSDSRPFEENENVEELMGEESPETRERKRRERNKTVGMEIVRNSTVNDSSRLVDKNISEKDFERVKILGKGSFGKVILVKRKKEEGEEEFYAMKVLHKSQIIKKNCINTVKMERHLLAGICHPFIISLKFTFQTRYKLFFIMEYVDEGDLEQLLHKHKKFNESTTKFYAAQLILGIKFLHEKYVLHRDMKLSNILIDKNGYIRITDFVKREKGMKPKLVCGSFEYVAYEMVKSLETDLLERSGYNHSVDFWIYEMLFGITPFRDPNEDAKATLQNILTKEIEFPEEPKISKHAKDIIVKLLCKDPKKRLGYKGADDVKKHPFFNGMDWGKLYERKLPSPLSSKKPPLIPLYQRPKIDLKKLKAEKTENDPELWSPDTLKMTISSEQLFRQHQQDFGDFKYNEEEKEKFEQKFEKKQMKNIIDPGSLSIRIAQDKNVKNKF